MWKNGFPKGNGYYWVNYKYNDRLHEVLAKISNRYNHVLSGEGIVRWRETYLTILIGNTWRKIKVKRKSKKIYLYDKRNEVREIKLKDFKYWNRLVNLIPDFNYEDIEEE